MELLDKQSVRYEHALDLQNSLKYEDADYEADGHECHLPNGCPCCCGACILDEYDRSEDTWRS